MRYQVKIYVGTHFTNDIGANVSIEITADSEEQARERAFSILRIDKMDAEAYETWEVEQEGSHEKLQSNDLFQPRV